MIQSHLIRLLVILLVCVPGLCPGEPLPDGYEVIQRVLARAQSLAKAESAPQYTYSKELLLEELDGRDQPAKSELRLYEGRWVRGVPLDRLVEIRGRQLTEAEFRKEAEREERLRRRLAGVDFRKKAAEREAWVTQQLLARYQFEVQQRLLVDERSTLVVSFRPKSERLPQKTLADKLLNRLAGTVWVDEADADVPKFTVHLVEPVSFGWFGILGAVTQCEGMSERQRMPSGVWVPTRQSLLVKGRLAFRPLRYRLTETISGYRLAGEAQ